MKEQLSALLSQITADKKKLSVMICTLAIGLLLWGRLLLQGVPRTATAGEQTVAAEVDAPDPVQPATTRTAKQPVVEVFVDLPGSPGRDPFGLLPNRYRPDAMAQGADSSAKSGQVTSDDDPRVDAVRREAGELRLESVVTGARPRAYISGRMLAPGDEIDGFTLVKVNDRHVILTKYGLFIRLRM